MWWHFDDEQLKVLRTNYSMILQEEEGKAAIERKTQKNHAFPASVERIYFFLILTLDDLAFLLSSHHQIKSDT